MGFLDYLHSTVDRRSMTEDEAEAAMIAILSGEATPAQVAGFLVALRMKGETAEELRGFARAMRAKANRIIVEGPLVDTCGTGGDGSGTFNISTTAAFIVAGAGVPVAKHGNRSISSKCGSADILEAMGVKLAISPQAVAACIEEVGLGFMFAPAFHPAVKHAQQARVELKLRTAFNLLGPLANPAGARFQVIGAPREDYAELMAAALAGLDPERAFVVCGEGGLDEVSTSGRTAVFEVRAGSVSRFSLHPDDFGVPVSPADAIRGGGLEENLEIIRGVLAGVTGPARDVVLVNAAVALVVAGAAADYRQGVELAAESIDSGSAAAKALALAEFTQSV